MVLPTHPGSLSDPGLRPRSSLVRPGPVTLGRSSGVLPSEPGFEAEIFPSEPRASILPSQPLCPPAAPPIPQAPEIDGGRGQDTRDAVRRPAAVARRPVLLTSHSTHRAALGSPQTHSFPRSDQIQTHPRISRTRPPSAPSPVAALTRSDAARATPTSDVSAAPPPRPKHRLLGMTQSLQRESR